MRRDRESEEERVWHDAERNQALDIIQRSMECGGLALPTVWKIRKILQSAAEDVRQSANVRERGAAMLRSVSLPELFDAFHVLCTNEWGYNTEADGFVIVSDRRRNEEAQAIAELIRLHPDPADQVRAMDSLIGLAKAAGVDPISVDSFFSRLCRDREFLSAFTEHLLAYGNSVLRQVYVKSATNFMPLFAGAATPERARRTIHEHLLNPDEFWLAYPVAATRKPSPTTIRARATSAIGVVPHGRPRTT
jgi:hypothetical protein